MNEPENKAAAFPPAGRKPAHKVVCITQARTTSVRLPGKIMMEAAGKPLLQWHLERLSACRSIDETVLATTENAADDPAVDLASSLGVPVFRGSETDVLGRFRGAAEAAGATVVVRATADCPLIDPTLIDALVGRFMRSREAGDGRAPDYQCIDVGVFPRGLDAEVFTVAALNAAAEEAKTPWEREHVTPFVYGDPDRFFIGAPLRTLEKIPPYRWCVDEAADLELVRRILSAMPPDRVFDWRDCCMALSLHPEWAEINRDVAQRKAGV